MNSARIYLTPSFEKSIKKLPKSSKIEIDKIVKILIKDPSLGQLKKGDLSQVRVYKFKLVNQLTLLAYSYENAILTLLLLGGHENFYKNLKRKVS